MEHCLLAATLMIAAIYDHREDRIPNLLCILGSLFGMAAVLYRQGITAGICHSLWAVGICVVFVPLWLMRAVGAGDIKLMMSAGVLLGGDSISFLLFSGGCMGIQALISMVVRKNYFTRMNTFFRYAMECWTLRQWKPYPFEYEKDGTEGGIRLSYSLLAGHLLAMLLGVYR